MLLSFGGPVNRDPDLSELRDLTEGLTADSFGQNLRTQARIMQQAG